MEDLITTRDCPGYKVGFTVQMVNGVDCEIPVVTYGGLMLHRPMINDTDIELVPQFALSHRESGFCLGYTATSLERATSVMKALVDKFKITQHDSVELLLKVVSFKHEIKRMRVFGSLKRNPVPADEEVDTSELSVQEGWPY